jgi:uncharacterized protein
LVKIFITSIAGKAGKTMLSVGLGKYWLDHSKKVGYLNHSSAHADQSVSSNPDTLFMQKVLGLNEQGSNEKDIVIIEGRLDALSALISEYPDCKVLLIHDYAEALPAAIVGYQKFGSSLKGVVINKVPLKNMEIVRNKFAVELDHAKISLIGLIPEDRVLLSLAVSDLAEAIHGKIVNNPDNSSDLIENLMIGSSTFDRGPIYYSRKSNKAVLLWGERPGFRKAALAGLQLAALQTSTRCIVISANAAPTPAAVQKADELKASIISAPGTLPDIEAAIEKTMPNLKFSQEKKLLHLLEILKSNLNIPQLNTAIGFLS